jgi:hypothetical protein
MTEDLIKEATQEVGPAQDDISTPEVHTQHNNPSVWPIALLITVIILLLVVGLNVLVDAEILKLPIPHTDFL